MIRLVAVGWKAHAALERSGGTVRRLAALSDSTYVTAVNEILWLGRASAALHPRAMLAAAPFTIDAEATWIDVSQVVPWRAELASMSPATGAALVAGCSWLRAAIHDIGEPEGLGLVLLDGDHADPFLTRAIPAARALGRACCADDATAALEPATALLGLGPGLTPAGDDYVGGALFARALLSRADAERRGAWERVAAEIAHRAGRLTHPISAALLADLLDGDGHAPLHDLADAMARSAAPSVALDAARRLVRIGHSSGWDMLAGFIAGVIGV